MALDLENSLDGGQDSLLVLSVSSINSLDSYVAHNRPDTGSLPLCRICCIVLLRIIPSKLAKRSTRRVVTVFYSATL